MTCPCHAEPYRTVRVDEFAYQVCATVARAIEAEEREACAMEAIGYAIQAAERSRPMCYWQHEAGKDVAAAIRTRGTE